MESNAATNTSAIGGTLGHPKFQIQTKASQTNQVLSNKFFTK